MELLRCRPVICGRPMGALKHLNITFDYQTESTAAETGAGVAYRDKIQSVLL